MKRDPRRTQKHLKLNERLENCKPLLAVDFCDHLSEEKQQDEDSHPDGASDRELCD